MIVMAKSEDFEKIVNFYYKLIDDMKNEIYIPGWEKDIYPSKEYIRNSIVNKTLFINAVNNGIIAAMIVDNDHVEGYDRVEWNIDVIQDEILVIHALGISHEYQGLGIAKEMVQFVKEYGKDKSKKTIRLDVLKSNIPAQKLYLKMGFKYVDTIELLVFF